MQSQQIRGVLPRTVTPVSSRYPQLLCVLARFLESFRSSSPGLTWLDPGNRSNRQSKMARRIKSGDDTVQTIALPAPLGRVNDAATCRRILRRSGTAPGRLHDFKTTGHGLLRGGESPLSDATAC